jgi:putative nucleotidyltransferase with HDIG domain
MTNVQKILRRVEKLPPIPAMIHKILALADDHESSFLELVELVEHDPAITANLLKVCNSAHLGLPVKVDSVQRALTLLGYQQIVELVIEQNLGADLQRSQKGYRLEKGDLWKQSVATAKVAKTLAQRQKLANLPAIYTAALLKDVGKVILHEFVANEFSRIQEKVEKKGLSFIEAEKACIGMDHATLGGIIAREWHFNSHLIYMIENHHLSDPVARRDPATASIYLADMVAMMAGTCIGVDRLAYPVYEEIFSDYFLTKEELKALMFSYEGFLAGAQRMLDPH